MQQWQCWVVATETEWTTEPKIFTMPLYRKDLEALIQWTVKHMVEACKKSAVDTSRFMNMNTKTSICNPTSSTHRLMHTKELQQRPEVQPPTALSRELGTPAPAYIYQSSRTLGIFSSHHHSWNCLPCLWLPLARVGFQHHLGVCQSALAFPGAFIS